MYPTKQRGSPQVQSPSRHISALSQDTTISGIADSTISNAESLRLSQFPQPPASTPATPIRPGFGTPSPSRSTFTNRSVPLRRKPSLLPTSEGLKGFAASRPAEPRSHPVSPYDWHDGASSIGNGIDVTEDRLLSTSFITSLLQEKLDKQGNRRTSYSSDALSGFSEMTYPPLAPSMYPDSFDQSSSVPAAAKAPSQRLQAPPTSYTPIPESLNRISGDSDTLYSARDHGTSIVRAASIFRSLNLPGATVVRVAPAVLHSVSANIHLSSAHSEIDYPLAGGSTSVDATSPMIRTPRPNIPTPQIRTSVHSTKSGVSSFVSRLSLSRPVRRVMAWTNVKPLPPIPLIPHISTATEIEHRRAEGFKTLPDLVHRADALEGLLEKGYHPHHSHNSYSPAHKGKTLTSGPDDVMKIRATANHQNLRPSNYSLRTNNGWRRYPDQSVKGNPPPKKQRLCVLFGVFLTIVLAAVGTAVGIAVGRNKRLLAVCPSGFAGAACNLNSTCVCISSLSKQCDGLAQNIIDLIPSVNHYFLANFTENAVYDKIRLVRGSVPGDCASQSVLVDVALVVDPQTVSNTTRWAQAALLWNLVESQDLNATTALQKFIQDAPWDYSHLANDTSAFSTTVSGYTFNFVTQEVTQPNVSFVAIGQPTAAQLSRVGPAAHSALDRMYSFAQAASTQHQKALEVYWTTVLQQKLSDLPTFMSALSVSPILLPFDATSSQQPQSISTLLTNSSSTFPPPLGCYPGLRASQVQQVNTIEDNVFGLPLLSNVTQFDSACYPNRPIYGVLDVLRLRLPFADTRSSVPRQAAVSTRDVAPRAVLHSGAILSPLPGPSNVTEIATQLSDPRQYGTLGQWNHVVLQYLSSMPDINVATALVAYVLSSASRQVGPPTNTSILFKSLVTIPILEVAVFGSVISSDISSAVSSFTTPSGSLFFGSEQGTALRNWAITSCGASIAWAESPLSPLIVQDHSFSDTIFQDTWNAVSTALQNNIQNIGLANVTESFNVNQKFTPS